MSAESREYPVQHGPSIIELLERELDTAYATFMDERTDHARGVAHGLATAVAVAHNPYAPNRGEAKRAAVERYEAAR